MEAVEMQHLLHRYWIGESVESSDWAEGLRADPGHCLGHKIIFSIHFSVVGTGQDTTYSKGSVWLAAGATQASSTQSTQLEFRQLQIEGK